MSERRSRSEYLAECATYAREQVLFHMRHRDHWLEYQLLAQAALLALASGIEIGGVRSASVLPDVMSLAVPVSFVFAALYVVEDRLTASFCGYLQDLSRQEARLAGAGPPIVDAETWLRRSPFGVDFLPTRLAAQIVAFLLIPAGIGGYRFASMDAWNWIQGIEAGVALVLWVATVFLLARAYMRHVSFDPEGAHARAEPIPEKAARGPESGGE